MGNIDKYLTTMLSVEQAPKQFRPTINTVYPPNNNVEFERWVFENYIGCDTDRVYLPVFWTGYYVNNNYGNDKVAITELQDYINSLDKTKKYWTIVQYDDSILNDVSGLDILRFEMSNPNHVHIPLIGQPHPFTFSGPKKWEANFVGSRTHPVRNELENLKKEDGYYVSFEQHSIEEYCKIIHESMFTLCPRGYGVNSFRIAEALQYGSIPIYISDDFIHPFGLDFHKFGVVLNSRHIKHLEEKLASISTLDIIEKQKEGKRVYQEYFTYEGCLKNIINILENERNKSE